MLSLVVILILQSLYEIKHQLGRVGYVTATGPKTSQTMQTTCAMPPHWCPVHAACMCCRTVLTVLIWKPEVVCEEVGHVVVQPLQHVQGIIDEEDCVIIAIQHPLEVVIPSKVGSQKGRHSSPVQSNEQVTWSTETCFHC